VQDAIYQIVGGIRLLIASALLIATTLQLDKAFENVTVTITIPDDYEMGKNWIQGKILAPLGFKQDTFVYYKDEFHNYIKYSDKLAAGVSVYSTHLTIIHTV